MPKPTIVFVPGLWEGPAVFGTVSSTLRSQGYPTFYAPLASTGCPSPGNPTLLDDVNYIRSVIQPLVLAGKEIVLVCHSAGGLLGSAAIKGLLLERGGTEKSGGVSKLVFLTAGVAPAGFKHPEVLPFYDIQGDKMYCVEPRNTLFNDLSELVAESWIPTMKCQPATNWAEVIDYAAWTEIPSMYLVCEKDAAIPVEQQLYFAATAGSEIEHCDAGHMVMLSQPEVVVEFIRKAAGEKV